MKINDIIELVYPLLLSKVKDNKVISLSKTDADVLGDVVLRALNIFKDKDITFEEGKEYLINGLKQEIYFQYKKVKNDNLVYVETVWDNETEEPEE